MKSEYTAILKNDRDPFLADLVRLFAAKKNPAPLFCNAHAGGRPRLHACGHWQLTMPANVCIVEPIMEGG